jgi:outer membrane protein TolC
VNAIAGALSLPIALVLLGGCTVDPYRPAAFDAGFRPPVGTTIRASGGAADATTTVEPSQRPQPNTPLGLDEVLTSVTERYPPWLSVLLERDLASGRLRQANGNFDPMVAARLGGQLQGFYESTAFEAMVEQPLTTGDVIYGGYRVSDGLLPDYDKKRTQDDGELVLGGRLPLLRDRAIDRRRAAVRQAQIDVELADPTIARARIDFVRAATRTYYGWVAAGRRLVVTKELLRLATDRSADLQRAVERQFLAAIDVTDNDRLIAQRQVFVVRAERQLQQAALELSLFLRDPDDAPIVPASERLPIGLTDLGEPAPPDAAQLQADLETAIRQRPELRRFQLQIDRVDTDRRLAENQTLPNLDVVVEASRSLSDDPYKDPSENELFIGGELKLPLRRSDAFGRLEQASAQLSRLRLEERFARDRVVNEIVDLRSALLAAFEQIAATARNVELAQQLVAAERRAFELGRSDLFRIQQRELQLADAQVLEVEATLDYHRSRADYRAALGGDGAPATAKSP